MYTKNILHFQAYLVLPLFLGIYKLIKASQSIHKDILIKNKSALINKNSN